MKPRHVIYCENEKRLLEKGCEDLCKFCDQKLNKITSNHCCYPSLFEVKQDKPWDRNIVIKCAIYTKTTYDTIYRSLSMELLDVMYNGPFEKAKWLFNLSKKSIYSVDDSK